MKDRRNRENINEENEEYKHDVGQNLREHTVRFW